MNATKPVDLPSSHRSRSGGAIDLDGTKGKIELPDGHDHRS
jgi:hypothetical protein